MKQPRTNHGVEVAHLVNGELISVKRLSPRTEWRSATAAGGAVLAFAVGAAVLVAVALLGAGRVVYGPGYVALWVVLGMGAAAVAGSRALARARRYAIGAAIDDDAFSSVPLSLVRRSGTGYQLVVAPGMTGRFEGGRSPVLIESLVQQHQAQLPLGHGTRAEVSLASTTFVVSAAAEEGQDAPLPAGFVRRFARRALLPLELAALASVLCAVPAGARLGEADMRSAIPADATPWEIEKMLRSEAQVQARTLHQCFDVVPVECQRPGYVGVGLSLSKSGEIRSRWIARSTYAHDCPVEQCMSDVISTWFFEPLPEPMNVVLPVQVLRTDKPLPIGRARAAENAARLATARNGVN